MSAARAAGGFGLSNLSQNAGGNRCAGVTGCTSEDGRHGGGSHIGNGNVASVCSGGCGSCSSESSRSCSGRARQSNLENGVVTEPPRHGTRNEHFPRPDTREEMRTEFLKRQHSVGARNMVQLVADEHKKIAEKERLSQHCHAARCCSAP